MSSLNKKILNTERLFIESGENKGHIKINEKNKVVTCDWDVLGSLKMSRDSNLRLNVSNFFPVGNYVNISSMEAGDPLASTGTMTKDEYVVGYIYKQSSFEKKRWYIIQIKSPLVESQEITANFLFQLEEDYSTGKRECYPLTNFYYEKILGWINFQVIAEPRNSSSVDLTKSLIDCDYIGFYCKFYLEQEVAGSTYISNSVFGITSMTIKPLPLFLDIDGYSELHSISEQ